MSLHPGAQYGLVKSVRLVGMMLLIYARRELQPHISRVRSARVGTGREGKMVGLTGNKGAVGVSLRCHQTDLCIVNSHLAAHKLETEKRNEDFHLICNRMEFGQEEDSKDSDLRRIQDHRMGFWLGDLNYRLDDLRTEEVKRLVTDNALAQLLEHHDQLGQERHHQAVFVGWSEGRIRSDWSTLIGRGPTLLRSHWSKASPEMLAPAVLCHKEPPMGVFCVPKPPY